MTNPTDVERADLLDTLAERRNLFTGTVQGLSDEQARLTPIPSTTLSLGGLVKHVAATESMWAAFAVHGAPADRGEPDHAAWADGFRLRPDESLEGVLAQYRSQAEVTDELVRTIDLDSAHPLPEAPWFEPGVAWSARRVFLHVVAETAQHAGHADLLREAIDGRKSMG